MTLAYDRRGYGQEDLGPQVKANLVWWHGLNRASSVYDLR